MIVLPWSSREALLERVAAIGSNPPVIDPFVAAGTSAVVQFTDQAKRDLARVIDHWTREAGGSDGLPEGIWKLGRWLRIDTGDRHLLARPILVIPHFEKAREALDQGHPALAVVMTQTAAEVSMARALTYALDLRDVPADLHDWMYNAAVDRSSSPAARRVRKLWNTLTGDELGEMPEWNDYAQGVERRHDFVHHLRDVS